MPHDAAKLLQDKGFKLVEYGEQLTHRFGRPMTLQSVDWALENERVTLASQILHQNGYLIDAPSKRLVHVHRIWESMAFIHKVYSNGKRLSLRIKQYPLSFVGLSLQDTVEVMSPFISRPLLAPTPQSYMLSLIHYLLKCPLRCNYRHRVESKLYNFISFFILQEDPFTFDDEDDESVEYFQRRAEDAILQIQKWDWGAVEKKYLDIVEKIIRDCRVVKELPDSYVFPDA